MNISKAEQRVLHVLAQGGHIVHERDGGAKIVAVTCFTREGHVLTQCDLDLFNRLRRRGLIASRGGRPFVLSMRGRISVRAQLDNR